MQVYNNKYCSGKFDAWHWVRDAEADRKPGKMLKGTASRWYQGPTRYVYNRWLGYLRTTDSLIMRQWELQTEPESASWEWHIFFHMQKGKDYIVAKCMHPRLFLGWILALLLESACDRVYLLVGDCSGGRMEAITPTSLSFPTGEPSAVRKSK